MTNLPPHFKLPRGLWKDPLRDRYRVRIYRRNRVIHLSYHHTLAEALEAHRNARKQRARIRKHEGPIAGVTRCISALNEDLI